MVVCAGRPKAPAPIAGAAFETGPFVPEVEMLGGKLDVAVEQRGSLMGSAPTAMARFKLKF
ncbi:MAG: hypothetical protein FJ335_12635 [Sphingomonadales bacterium]|nr:hypothetical protein [Sphingomonadales bacterium]